MRIAGLIFGITLVILALVLYAQVDYLSFISPTGEGPILLISLLLGLIGDIIIIGFLVSYVIQSTELKKWGNLSQSLSAEVLEDTIDLIHAEELFVTDVLTFTDEFAEFQETDADIELWRGLHIRCQRISIQGAELVAICATISRTIALFPIQFAPDPKRLVALGVRAAQVSEQSIVRSQSTVVNNIHNQGIENWTERDSVAEFAQAQIGLYDTLYSQLHTLYIALIEFGTFDPKVMAQTFKDQEGVAYYVKNTLTPKAVFQASTGHDQDAREAWATVLDTLVTAKLTSESTITDLMTEFDREHDITLYKGTNKAKRLTKATQPAQSDKPIPAEIKPEPGG
jgi:hypothetical protein